MTDAQRRAAAKQFAADWAGKGYEKGHSQTFWLALLQKVYGVVEPDKFINFEDQIMLDHTSFIDGFIPTTHVLIEQKGIGKDLNKPIKQSDGSLLTPFQQANRYAAELPYSQRPRWIVTCNFAEFHVYDMERPTGEAEVIKLADLEKEYYRLQFLVDTGDSHIKKEMEVSLKAGELVGVLYDALLKQYKDPSAPDTLKSLNALCVRLVFCMYAEDAGIFGRRDISGIICQFLIFFPDMTLYRLYAILGMGTELSGRAIGADLWVALVFPVSIPVGGAVFQSLVFGTDDAVVKLIIDIFPPLVSTFPCLGTLIGCGENSAIAKYFLANMRRLVSAVGYNRFNLGKALCYLVIYLVKCNTVMYIAGSYHCLQHKTVFVTGSMGFISKLPLVVPLYE